MRALNIKSLQRVERSGQPNSANNNQQNAFRNQVPKGLDRNDPNYHRYVVTHTHTHTQLIAV
jgi:hypothetical protein